jgi:hypothetical protein
MIFCSSMRSATRSIRQISKQTREKLMYVPCVIHASIEWIALSNIVDPYLYPHSASIKWAKAEMRTQRAFRLPVHRECRKSGWQRQSRRVGSGASTSCGSNGAPMVGGHCTGEMLYGTPLGTGDGSRIGTGAAAGVSVGSSVGCAAYDGWYDGTDT